MSNPLREEEIERSLRLLESHKKSFAKHGKGDIERSIFALSTYLKSIKPAVKATAKGLDDGEQFSTSSQRDGLQIVDFYNCEVDDFGVILGQKGDARERTNRFGKEKIGCIFVESIVVDSRTYYDGRLEQEDEILEINGHSTDKMTLERARCVENKTAAIISPSPWFLRHC